MNALIVSPKSDVKAYESILKTASNTNVLGAVTTVKTDFINDLKNKWNPHIVLIDTAVSYKNINIAEVIFNINKFYPYIKVIILTDENDSIDYPASYAVIRGDITNLQLKDIINTTIHKSNSDEFEDKDGSGVTRKLYPQNITEELPTDKVDNLSTQLHIKIPDIKKRKKHRYNKKKICIICAAASVVVLLTVIIVLLKINTPTNNIDAAEETTVTTISDYQLNEEPTEEETKLEPDVIVSEDITATSANITEEPPTTVKNESTKPTRSETSSSSDSSSKTSNDNKSSSSENRSADSRTNNDNYSSSNKSEEVNNNPSPDSKSYSNSAVISYGNNDRYNNNNSNEVSSVKLSYNSKTMYVGDTLTLTATVVPSTASYSLSWSTSNSSVVTVNNGYLVAKSPGTATVYCRASDKSATCSVTVKNAPAIQQSQTDNVYLSVTSKTLSVGQSYTLTLQNCSNASFSVNDPSIVVISNKGNNFVVLRAIKKGTTTVVAQNSTTGKSYRCTITVK